MSIRVPGASLLIDGRDAVLMVRLMAAGRREFAREGLRFSSGQAATLSNLDMLARAFRESSSDPIGPVGPGVVGPCRTMADITTSVAAGRLQVTERQVVRLINSGRLPARRVNGRWSIDPVDLDEFLEARK